MGKVCLNKDDGNTDLCLQRVEVFSHIALLVAEVNNDLRVGGQQRLEVQICLATVHLAGLGERGEVCGQEGHLALAGRGVDRDHALRGDRSEDHRCDGAAGRDAGDICRELDGPAEAVGEGHRLGFGRSFFLGGRFFRLFRFRCGLFGGGAFGLRGFRRSGFLPAGCAAGHETGNHDKGKQKRENSSVHFRTSYGIVILNIE